MRFRRQIKAMCKPVGIVVIGSLVLWLVMGALYLGTIRWVFTITHHPPITQTSRWNNLWAVGGSFAWSRYDPLSTKYPQTYRAPTLRAGMHVNTSGYWHWKFWYRNQVGGWYIRIPIWVPMTALTPIGPFPTLIFFIRYRARKKALLAGLCPSCKYPRPEKAIRCPECGTKFAPALPPTPVGVQDESQEEDRG